MADPRDDAASRTAPEPGQHKPGPTGADAAKLQREEADEEGANKRSVPVEDLTTANDSGQG